MTNFGLLDTRQIVNLCSKSSGGGYQNGEDVRACDIKGETERAW